MGTIPLGNLYVGLSDEEAEATVVHAVALGVRYVDTAPAYGYGLTEERVGRALARTDRSRWVVSTKVGRPLGREAPLDAQAMAERSRCGWSPGTAV